MRIDEATIRAAFAKHEEVYARQKDWSVSHHVDCWRHAARAFARGGRGEADFEWLYESLRRRWLVFRGAKDHWSPGEAFRRMSALDSAWRRRRLADLDAANIGSCRRILEAMKGIKTVESGASVVAISKFLHFWNPRLFVIVDDAMMWRWVFKHSWIRDAVVAKGGGRNQIEDGEEPVNWGKPCDIAASERILGWAGDLVRQNPYIPTCFAKYVRSQAVGAVDDLPLETYEAAACEWLLLGLVEVCPRGVSLE